MVAVQLNEDKSVEFLDGKLPLSALSAQPHFTTIDGRVKRQEGYKPKECY